MKKYIRTKDDIYEFEGHFAWIDDCYLDDKRVISYRLLQVLKAPYAIKEIDIIKTADTIEELCDFVFVKYNDNSRPDIVDLHTAGDLGLLFSQLKKELSFVDYIKLAIETDKGLIYVAKINDKGELELL